MPSETPSRPPGLQGGAWGRTSNRQKQWLLEKRGSGSWEGELVRASGEPLGPSLCPSASIFKYIPSLHSAAALPQPVLGGQWEIGKWTRQRSAYQAKGRACAKAHHKMWGESGKGADFEKGGQGTQGPTCQDSQLRLCPAVTGKEPGSLEAGRRHHPGILFI